MIIILIHVLNVIPGMFPIPTAMEETNVSNAETTKLSTTLLNKTMKENVSNVQMMKNLTSTATQSNATNVSTVNRVNDCSAETKTLHVIASIATFANMATEQATLVNPARQNKLLHEAALNVSSVARTQLSIAIQDNAIVVLQMKSPTTTEKTVFVTVQVEHILTQAEAIDATVKPVQKIHTE